MGLRINTNVASIQAQHALSKSTTSLNRALTRLSTGLRINTGSDDVVGLAKSESLRSQIRGISQSKSNIAAVTGVLGVAEGYLAQLTGLAQDLRETAVQASDGTISSSDRDSLQDKYTQLLNEYRRLSEKANFNGVNLLDGTFVSKSVQVGPQEGDLLTISISDARYGSIGQVAIFTSQTRSAISTNSSASAAFTGPSGSISVAGVTVPVSAYTSDGVSYLEKSESAIAYVNAINSVSGQSGVTAYTLANVVTIDYSSGVGLESQAHLVINGITCKSSALVVSAGDDTDMSSLLSLINQNSIATGVIATIDTSNDKLILTASDGRNISLQVSAKSATTSSFNVFGMTGSTSVTQSTIRGTFKLQSTAAFSISGAANEFTSGATQSVTVSSTTALSYTDLSTATNSQSAITTLDNVIAQLQTKRATVGSTLNRFQVSLSELDSRSENLQAAESAIRDADVAEETAKLTQYQILQQAGATVLAQANSAPQIALTLLQNL